MRRYLEHHGYRVIPGQHKHLKLKHDTYAEVLLPLRPGEGIAHPLFWEDEEGGKGGMGRTGGKGQSDWYWRGMFDRIPLPLAWPVYVSHAEATAYARKNAAARPYRPGATPPLPNAKPTGRLRPRRSELPAPNGSSSRPRTNAAALPSIVRPRTTLATRLRP